MRKSLVKCSFKDRQTHTQTNTHRQTDTLITILRFFMGRNNNKFPWNCRSTYTHKWPAGKENDVKYSEDYLSRRYNRTLLCARRIDGH